MNSSMNNQYWNSLAESFTDHVLEISSYDQSGVLKEEIAHAAKNGRVAADLGCGTGGFLKDLSPHFKILHAVDYAVELLEKARERTSSPNIKYTHHNLAGGKPLPFKADVTFCVNALISPSSNQREKMARCVWRTTKFKGVSIFVVPSFESAMNTYHARIRCQMREGKRRHHAVREMERLYRKEVKSSIDRIVSIGGTLTKCFTREEIAVFLSDIGFEVLRIRKIEYPWSEELDHVPQWLKDPYPCDWFALARKT